MELAGRAPGMKSDTLLAHGAIARVLANQRVCLKTTRVGNNRMWPARHGMQASKARYRGGAGMLHQVKGVHNERLDAAAFQVNAIDCTDDAQCGVRQKGR